MTKDFVVSLPPLTITVFFPSSWTPSGTMKLVLLPRYVPDLEPSPVRQQMHRRSQDEWVSVEMTRQEMDVRTK